MVIQTMSVPVQTLTLSASMPFVLCHLCAWYVYFVRFFFFRGGGGGGGEVCLLYFLFSFI